MRNQQLWLADLIQVSATSQSKGRTIYWHQKTKKRYIYKDESSRSELIELTPELEKLIKENQ